MKKWILISAVAISTSLSYANQCESQWKISANGISLGNTTENFSVKEGGEFILKSKFTPNGAVKIFGVPGIERTTLSDKSGVINYREEKITKSGETKLFIWKKVGGSKWQKILEDKAEEPIIIKESIIDSTMLPYLSMLHLVEKNKPSSFNALGKGDPYSINFTYFKIGENWKLQSDVDGGYIILEENGNPLSFGTTQNNMKVVGQRISWKCE
jgi:hypothetical protein